MTSFSMPNYCMFLIKKPKSWKEFSNNVFYQRTNPPDLKQHSVTDNKKWNCWMKREHESVKWEAKKIVVTIAKDNTRNKLKFFFYFRWYLIFPSPFFCAHAKIRNIKCGVRTHEKMTTTSTSVANKRKLMVKGWKLHTFPFSSILLFRFRRCAKA